MYAFTVEPLYIKSGENLIAADFYRPKNIIKPVVIIMAPSFAGLRQFKLGQYAQRFAQAGYAVVIFDYRFWGASTGAPRELISLEYQIDDWKKVIQFLSSSDQVDARKIVLWGTALSGGYVLTLAAQLKNIYAIMVQTPFVDGVASAKLYPMLQLLKVLKLSSQDYMGSKIGASAKTLSVVHPSALCFMPSQSSYQGYMSIINPDYYWSGEVPARVFFHLIRYRPIQVVMDIQIPVLFIAAKYDHLIPIESSREAVGNMSQVIQYYEWDISHFDLYRPQWLEKSISTQLEFLHQHFGVT